MAQSFISIESDLDSRLHELAEQLQSILDSLHANADLLAGQIFDFEDMFRADKALLGDEAQRIDALLTNVIDELRTLGRVRDQV